MSKNIGVVGLGLIGASFCKAIKLRTQHKILGYDISEEVTSLALSDKVIDEKIDSETLALCDIVIIALYPKDTINFVKENIKNFKKSAVIVDCAGVKENICDSLFSYCKENELHFIGGHPMAGIEKSGYEASFEALFEGASMILCPEEDSDKEAVSRLEDLFSSIGFSKLICASPKKHDQMIAFTSQLAHVVSSAYIKSPSSSKHIGFSAGSFKDLTRVAYLNEYMWTQLFFENKDNLIKEIDIITKHLSEYKTALLNDDKEEMQALLLDGKLAKIKSNGN